MKIEEKYSNGLLDFHTHTTNSDGGDTPTELVERAKKQGVSAMALTDHNVISGLEEFRNACEKEGIFAIPFGTEIYAELPAEILSPKDNDAPDLVILGKNPRDSNDKIGVYQSILIKDWRERFFPQTMANLRKIGFEPPAENYKNAKTIKDFGEYGEFLKKSLTEGKNLEVLVNHVLSVNPEIIREDIKKSPIKYTNKYIFAIGQRGFAKRIEGFKVKDAVQLAEDINCKLFIAHPGGEYGFLSDAILDCYINQRVRGIEIRNYFNTPKQNAKFDKLAEKHNLTRSGGSDCHGDNGPFKIGIYDRPQNQLPKEVLQELLDNLP